VISIGSQRAILTISYLKQLNGIERISIIFAIWFNQLTANNMPVTRFDSNAGYGNSIHRQVKSKEWRNR
jgi:hypothetical protein